MAPAILLSQMASGVGLLAGAFAAKSLLDAEERATNARSSSSAYMPRPRCPTCNGSRRTPCFCSRWSDGDVGCGACGGSGMATCSSCGGSGTGRPIPVTLKSSTKPPL